MKGWDCIEEGAAGDKEGLDDGATVPRLVS